MSDLKSDYSLKESQFKTHKNQIRKYFQFFFLREGWRGDGLVLEILRGNHLFFLIILQGTNVNKSLYMIKLIFERKY